MNAARTGRKPSGPQIVERLEGSPSEKQRLEVILETIAGELTVPEACARLGIGESRFHDLRNQTLQVTLNTLEPRRLGRPPKPTSPEQDEIDALKAKLDRARRELAVADVQVSLARIHPGLLEGPPPAQQPAGKKHARGRPIRRSPRSLRNQVVGFLRCTGPHIGMPTLRAEFPTMPSSELKNMLRRFRRVWQYQNQRLRIHRPGDSRPAGRMEYTTPS